LLTEYYTIELLFLYRGVQPYLMKFAGAMTGGMGLFRVAASSSQKST